MVISYEEKRKQRMAENNKRMEQLNLHRLSQSLKSSLNKNKFKPSPVKNVKVKPGDFGVDVPLRRSSRMADKPNSNYKEHTVESFRGGKRKYNKIMTRKLFYQVYTSDDNRINAVERAEELEFRLGSEFPTFVKPIFHSHIHGLLNLPRPFCKTNLPKHDEMQMMTLIDETERECQIKYLPEYNGLGSGWRGFCIDHKLVDGDAIVFQLIKADTFKVYIIRVNSSEEDKSKVIKISKLCLK